MFSFNPLVKSKINRILVWSRTVKARGGRCEKISCVWKGLLVAITGRRKAPATSLSTYNSSDGYFRLVWPSPLEPVVPTSPATKTVQLCRKKHPHMGLIRNILTFRQCRVRLIYSICIHQRFKLQETSLVWMKIVNHYINSIIK